MVKTRDNKDYGVEVFTANKANPRGTRNVQCTASKANMPLCKYHRHAGRDCEICAWYKFGGGRCAFVRPALAPKKLTKPTKSVKYTAPDGKVCTYPSLTKAAAATGIYVSDISRYCRGYAKPRDGAKWEYASFEGEKHE